MFLEEVWDFVFEKEKMLFCFILVTISRDRAQVHDWGDGHFLHEGSKNAWRNVKLRCRKHDSKSLRENHTYTKKLEKLLSHKIS